MLPQRALRHNRIPFLRPLRPPSNLQRTAPQPRLFTQNTQLLLLVQHTPRPQIPYLSQPSFRHRQTLLGPNQQLARLLSTENRRYYREQFWLATKWTAIGWTFFILGSIAWLGIQIELSERKDPTPAEWRFWTRQRLRSARARKQDADTVGIIDWAQVGSKYRQIVRRLEDQEHEGKGLEEVLEGGVFIDAVGKAGFDISSKSWPWRSGYFEAIMGCAEAAEHLDGMVLDKTRSMVFPKEVVIGPSNPDPRPTPSYMHSAPLEENCVDPFEPPETYYMRVLTGKGFTTRQKLDAALGYANWLEYRGLSDSALEMYKWGVDIAKVAIPDVEHVFDSQTAVINITEAASRASPNLLKAVTGLAIHHARTGNVSAALPILLSVLRARRSAPAMSGRRPVDPLERYDNSKAEAEPSGPGSGLSKIAGILKAPQFPPAPSSGDEPLVKPDEKPSCDDAELMLYIGEILFATANSSSQSAVEGIGWTRQAVTVAEANLQNPAKESSDRKPEDRGMKCKECLTTGVTNWEVMLTQLAQRSDTAASREGGSNAGWLEWRGWFGRDGGVKGRTVTELSSGMIEEELKQVERLKKRIVREGIDSELEKARGAGSGLWIG